MESAIWGLIGTIVGVLASIGTTWMSARNSLRLQKQSAQDERTERARAFQRETLLELQEAIHDALRLINRAYIEDCASHGNAGSWGTSMLSNEVDEGIRLAQRKVAIYAERVSDDLLRSEIKSLMSMAGQVLLAKVQGEAEGGLQRAVSESLRVLESLGTVLRHNY